ncbi:peptidase C39 [Paraburkholderia sp.]|uniref:peptidase C39 n=1 Tax=Paraburkholderia sp. TaxID=1926495 RepID=UPI0023985F78|nr:peptidase C39 [Paraburkholderia sp.]MDE1183636.1 peptidase C39 [Paraburkholderia sp.]
MKRHLSQFGLALCTTMCGLTSGAFAAETAGMPAASDILSTRGLDPQMLKVQPVDDDVLSQQTGKYAGSSMISGFVLTVLSQWQAPNGATALAQGTLTAVQNAAGQMQATVSTLAKVTEGALGDTGANPNAQVNGGQNVAVNGVSQVTQVAGDRNLGSNSAVIDFNNNNVASLGTAGPAASTATNSTGTVKAGIAFGSNGVTVAVQTPAGIATQTIKPGSAQIAQLLQIAGNSQQVANQLQLHLQTQPMSAAMLRQVGVLQALQSSRR